MVIDIFENAEKYENLHVGFTACMELVQRIVTENAAPGRYEGVNGAYAVVSEYETRIDDAPRFENHREYIDVQVLVSGAETVLAGAALGSELVEPYTPDAEFYAAAAAVQSITLRPGVFALFFPGDAHAPGLADGGNPALVKKIVGKLPA